MSRYSLHAHLTKPQYRLVTAGGAPFPAAGREQDWRFTRARERADTNPDVARLVDETGYCLFRIGLTFDAID